MQIDIRADVRELQRKLKHAKKQLPFAIKRGLDATAFDLQRELKKTLPDYVHNPVAYTKAGIQVEKATKTNLVAEVGFASKSFGRAIGSIPQANYMKRLIEGGTRLPESKAIAVPYKKHMKPNSKGNIPRGKIDRLLGQKDKYFSGEPLGKKKGGGAGIWKRIGKGRNEKIKMQIAWKDKTDYQKSYPFKTIALNFVRKHFKNNFNNAIAFALKTAR
jgi:hypothetical protein